MKKTIRRHFSRISVTMLLMLLTSATAWAQEAISGLTYNTAGGYYEIPDAAALNALAAYVNAGNEAYGKTFKQTADITFSHTSDWNNSDSNESNFSGIGNSTKPFKGSYYGQGFIISGVRMYVNDSEVGLFRYARNATIDGIVLADSRITGHSSTGGIVGHSYKDGGNCIVNNCHVRSNVLIHHILDNDNSHGGIVGSNGNGCEVTNCTSAVTITGGSQCQFFGGVVGSNGGTMSNNIAIGVTIRNIDKYYGAIAGTSYYTSYYNSLNNNYYYDCIVQGSTSNIGCDGSDKAGAFNASPNHFTASGSEYAIKTATGWNVFCECLNHNDRYSRFSGKTVKLDADIEVSRMAGSSGHDFCGTFDGQEHTLTFNYGTSDTPASVQNVAPFSYISTVTPTGGSEVPAAIKNLHVAGDIYTSAKYAAGIVGQHWGTLNIENCRSSIVIHSSTSGDGTHGGIEAASNGTLNITGCVFDGKLLTTGTTATTLCGGFVGYGTLNISNSLYAPAALAESETEITSGSCTFVRNSSAGSNCYYTRTLGTAQGEQIYSITAGENMTSLDLSGTATTTYSVSGIAFYANNSGLKCGNTCYAGNGDNVALTLSHTTVPTGYSFSNYAVSAGSLSGTTLTMPNANVTVSATYTCLTYNITYNLAGGSVAGVNPTTYNVENETFTLINPTRTGYTFSGWTGSNGSTPQTTVTIAKGSTDNRTYTANWTPNSAHFSVSGDTYTIHTATGWNVFCDCLNDNTTYNRFSGKTVKLGANIEVSRMAGSSTHDFCGTFDGDNHTLTFTSTENTDRVAPFSYISNVGSTAATIRKLNVVANITTTGQIAGGIVGEAWGKLTIEHCTVSGTIATSNQFAGGIIGSVSNSPLNITDCRSSVTISSSKSGDGTHGGFAGRVPSSASLNISGCVFDGKIVTTNGTANCGGFVGHSENLEGTNVSIANSLYAPTADDNTVSEGCMTFARNVTAANITNSYYTRTLGTAQGKAPRTVTAGQDVTVSNIALTGNATAYTTSGITAYSGGGLSYNNNIYYGNGDNVSLTLSHDDHTGYTFSAYTASAGTLNGNTLTMPDADVTIGANYTANTYTVHFNGNGNTGGSMSDQPFTYDTPQALTANTFTRAFTVTYKKNENDNDNENATATATFDGWATSADGAKVYDNQQSVSNLATTGTVNLYAKWTDGSVTLPTPTRTGYTFGGWYSDAGLTASVGAAGASYTPSADIILYAKWTANTYTVQFNGNGATSGTMSNQSFTYDAAQNLTANDFTRAFTVTYNFNDNVNDNENATATATFNGWATSANGAKVYNNQQSVSNLATTGTVNLYAKWTDSSVTLPTPTKTGYTFAGWYSDDGLTASVGAAGASYTPSANITLYAKWTANTYTVHFNGNGNTGGSMSDQSFTYDTAQNLTANAFTRTNGTFLGWATEAYGDVVYTDQQNVSNLTATNGGSVTLYAKWAIINTYTITYNLNGGTLTTDKTSYTVDNTPITLDVPTRTGYNFGGWYDNSGLTGNTVTTIAAGSTGDKSFWAKWTANSYTVHFNGNGATCGSMSDQSFTYDTAQNLTANAFTRTDYTFAGWATEANGAVVYNDQQSVSNLTATNGGSVTLYAKWIAYGIQIGDLLYQFTSATEAKVIACNNTATSVIIPATVTYDNVTLNVTAIDGDAFTNCTGLTEVFMCAETPPTLGAGAFDACTALTTIFVPDDRYSYTSADNWSAYYDKIKAADGRCGNYVYYLYDSTSKTLTIFGEGEMTDYYDDYYLPWKDYGDKIMTVVIRDGVTSIGDKAFYCCTNLTSIDIPASVTSIGYNAFSGCSGLTSINVPASVTSIDYNVLNGCSGLTSISVAPGNTKYDSRENCNALIETSSNTLLYGCKNTVIPNTVTSIGYAAFYRCTGLTSINVPASVTSIDYDAFYGCSGLTSIDIPASVTTIGYTAFHGCSSLTSIVIPASVTSIDSYAFYGCTGLTTVMVLRGESSGESQITKLSPGVFGDCQALTTIYVPTDKLDDYKTAEYWSNHAEKIKGFDEISTIALADKADNSGLITAVNGNTNLTVTLQGRTLYKDGDWNTLCLPFGVTAAQLAATTHPLYGATIMELDVTNKYIMDNGQWIMDNDTGTEQTGFDAASGTLYLYFKDANSVEAGKPYIIKWDGDGTDNLVNPVFSGVTIDETTNDVTFTGGSFKGTYASWTFGNDDRSILFLSSNNTLTWPKSGARIGAFRSYFDLGSNGAAVRTFTLNFGEDETTGISLTPNPSPEGKGNYKGEGSGYYTLDGRKHDKLPTRKGLYIHNGRKVVIK